MTSAEERGVSGSELTLMNRLWHHQKTNVKEDVDGNARNGGRSEVMQPKTDARAPSVTVV